MSDSGSSSVPPPSETQVPPSTNPPDPSTTPPPSDTVGPPSPTPTAPTDPTTTPSPPSPATTSETPLPPATTDLPTTSNVPPPSTSSDPPPPPPNTTNAPLSSTEAPPPPPDPTTSDPPTSVQIITVTPTNPTDATTVYLTTTSNTSRSSAITPTSSTSTRSTLSSTSSTNSATAVPVSGSHGLSQASKIAIAIVIPIIAVALIAFLAIFFWRRYRKRRDSEEMRRREVEEYGYNPNNDNSRGGVLAATSVTHGGSNDGQDMSESNVGYRGWGSTAGGRKAAAPLSTSASNATNHGPGGAAYSDSGKNGSQAYPVHNQAELYGGSALAGAGAGAALGLAHTGSLSRDNRDRHSNSPLLSSPTVRPSTADSSTIGAAAMTGPSELDDGLHRGDSVASSRYTNATRRSEGSDRDGPVGNAYGGHPNNNNNNYYSNDGADYYEDVANPYSATDYYDGEIEPDHQYQSPPVIQSVGARRNTRIETPPGGHYPQMPRQGNSGIAQNF